MAAKEVGDEWALSKQHLEQEVPIGKFVRGRKCMCVCVCVYKCVCVRVYEHVRRRCGYNTKGPADFEITTE